jgi:hypothetical protein
LYLDFSIADKFNVDAIKDTYERAFNEWKNDYRYLTELVMVLNWKSWEHYETNEEYTQLYIELWSKADKYATTHLKGDELSYFYKTTD